MTEWLQLVRTGKMPVPLLLAEQLLQAHQELFGGEMLVGAEGSIDNRLALGGDAQIFLRQKGHKPLFGAFFICICHAAIIGLGIR